MTDEYDVPLAKAFEHGYYEQMISLIRYLPGKALKTNNSLRFAVKTEVLRRKDCKNMCKHFNTTGLCFPEEHYMVNIDGRLEEIKRMG